ncbi:MAG: hypothetical protein IMF16_06020, partial [Proteobacteria bacterium]|nr:hypothetical protein [Pseudomonadota bacterium]
MRLSTLSLVLIVGVCAALASHPSLRLWSIETVRPEVYSVDYRALAESRPNDPDVWLAALSERWFEWEPIGSLEPYYQRAAELNPTSAAPHVFFAGLALEQVPLEREEINAFFGSDGFRWELQEHERYLRQSQRERLRKAGEALDRAAKLEEGNAAIMYLQAYVAFVDHEDQTALGLLRAALDTDTFDLYRGDIRSAAYRAASAAVPPEVAARHAFYSADPQIMFGGQFRQLAREAMGFSVLAEQRDDMEEAISLRLSMMHLGRLMLAGRGGIPDGFSGWSIWEWGAIYPLPDRAAEGSDATERRKAEIRRYAAYLQAQGDSELAENIGSLAATRGAWHEKSRDVHWRSSKVTYRELALRFGSEQATRAFLVLLAVMALGGAVAGVLRRCGKQVTSIRWTRVGWFVIVYGVLVVVYLAGLFGPGGKRLMAMSRNPEELVPLAWMCPAWGDYFAFLGIPLLVLSVAGVVVKQRRRSNARRAGFAGQYTGTLLAILLPVGAVLSLVVLGFALSGARIYGRHAEDCRAMLTEGELRHY